MTKYDWNKEKVLEAVNNSNSYSDVLRILEIPTRGRNIDTLKRKLEEYEIDHNHLTEGRYYKSGDSHHKYISAEKYFSSNKIILPSKLKDKLLKESYKENKCECCGITEWNNKPIVMQLHHIDGNPNNNKLENLQLLCPNCHSQTENFCGSANVTKDSNKKYYCPDCGKEINKGSKYCSICSTKHRKNNINKCPNLEQLIKDIKEIRNYVKLGQKYEVSDKAVVNWIIKYNLPYHIKELLEFVDNHSIEEIKEYSNIERDEVINNDGKFKIKYDHNLIIKLIDLNYTISEICDYIGCSKATVKGIGSKYKHKIRKQNIKTIACYNKDDELVKYCFGFTNAAQWLISLGYSEYSESVLSDKISFAYKHRQYINGYKFVDENLPEIQSIINDSVKEEKLIKLLYK